MLSAPRHFFIPTDQYEIANRFLNCEWHLPIWRPEIAGTYAAVLVSFLTLDMGLHLLLWNSTIKGKKPDALLLLRPECHAFDKGPFRMEQPFICVTHSIFGARSPARINIILEIDLGSEKERVKPWGKFLVIYCHGHNIRTMLCVRAWCRICQCIQPSDKSFVTGEKRTRKKKKKESGPHPWGQKMWRSHEESRYFIPSCLFVRSVHKYCSFTHDLFLFCNHSFQCVRETQRAADEVPWARP